jgi:hypothetical protein
MISVAPDGTVWTIGCEMIDHKSDAPGLDPNAGVLRHFDQAGKLIGSTDPQSRYVAPHQTVRLQSGYLVAKSDRIGWYSPRWGKAGRYVEISLPSMKESVYPGLPPLPTGSMIAGFALTNAGTASLSVYDRNSPRRWTTYAFDRATSKWIPAQVPAVGGSVDPGLVGSDGDQLVLQRGHEAAFVSVSR